MVNVLTIQDEEHIVLESSKQPSVEVKVRHVKVENEISTFEVSSEHETQGEKYYDASDELDEIDPLNIPKKQDRPFIFRI